MRVHSSFFFILALDYFPKGLPLKYRRLLCVSQLSSRWISVVPRKYKTPENTAFEEVFKDFLKGLNFNIGQTQSAY